MQWYYAENNERRGPIEEAEFARLVRAGTIKPETLVWHEGMASWQPFLQINYQPPMALAQEPAAGQSTASRQPGPGMGVCSESGKILPLSELVEIDGRLVSAEYKNVVLQRIREGVTGGGGTADPEVLAQQVLARGYEIKAGSCISRAFGLLKRHFWLTIGGTFLVFLVIGAAGMVPFGQLVVQGPLMGGLYWLFLRLIRGEPAAVGDAFQGFSRGWGQLVGAAIVSTLLIIPAFIPGVILFIVGAAQNENAALMIGGGALFLVGMLVAIYLTIGWMFALPLVIDKRLEFWPAMKLSRRVVGMHWWQNFGLIFLVGLLMFALFAIVALIGVAIAAAVGVSFAAMGNDPSAVVGLMIPLFIGIGILAVVTQPIAFGSLMYAYEDIFHPERQSQS